MRFHVAMAYHQHSLVAGRRTPATQTKYALVEGRFQQFVQQTAGRTATVADLNVSMVREFMVWLGGLLVPRKFGGTAGHGALTIKQHVSILKFLSKLLANDWPEEFPRGDPLARLKVPKVTSAPIEVFKREEIDRLLALTQATNLPVRNNALILFLVDTGCRLSEVINLTRKQVELVGAQRNGRARIVMSKGGKTRFVYFGGKCSKALSRYMATERDRLGSHLDYLFLNRSGQKMSPSGVQILFRKLGRLAGLDNVRCSPHTFRHTFATWYLRRHPGQLEQLRQLLGHANLTMVLVYAKLAEADIENTYESLVDDWSNLSKRNGRTRLEDEER